MGTAAVVADRQEMQVTGLRVLGSDRLRDEPERGRRAKGECPPQGFAPSHAVSKISHVGPAKSRPECSDDGSLSFVGREVFAVLAVRSQISDTASLGNARKNFSNPCERIRDFDSRAGREIGNVAASELSLAVGRTIAREVE